MYRSLIAKTGMACALVGLVWLSACSSGQEKIYVDRYETVKCTNCPKTKYVYKKPCPLPERVVRVHRVKEPCPPRRVVEVQLPQEPAKVRYEYINEGGCKPTIIKASCKSSCEPTCKKACCRS